MKQSPGNEGDEARAPERRRAEPVFNLPPVVLGLIGICVAVHIVSAYLLTDSQFLFLLLNAAFIPIRYSGQFALDITAFTSPLTYAFLHGSIPHLAINMIWLAAFGSPLANRMGAPRFLLFWAVTSLAAVALHYVLHMLDQAPLIGASGAISGMMGAAARFGFRIDRSHGRAAFAGAPLPIVECLRSRAVVTFLAIWMIINLATGLVGFAPGIDDQIAWEAHVGGFLAGFLGIDWFVRKEILPPLFDEPVDELEDPEDRPSGRTSQSSAANPKFASLLALIVAGCAMPAHAVEADGAVAAFVDRINATVAPIQPGDRQAIRVACARLIKQVFDIDAMAPVITAEAWGRMDAGQRAAYSRGLAKRAAADCASHGGEIAGNAVEFVGVRDGEGGERLIAVRQSKGRGRTVIWRVHRGPGGALKAVDMTVDGRSLAASARSDAEAILKKTDGNVIALIRSVGE